MATVDFDTFPLFTATVNESDEVLFKDVSTSQFFRVPVSNLIVTSDVALLTHENNVSNPHNVTKEQVGLSEVSNHAQLKVSSNLLDVENSALALINIGGVPIAQFNAHAGSTSNPHGVTANQVGAYSQTQTNDLLNAKAPMSHVADQNNPHNVSASQVGNEFAQWNANKLLGVEIDGTNLEDGRTLVYSSVSGKLEYSTVSSGGISSIEEASDTIFSLLTDGDLIVYSSASSAFLNLSVTSAGITPLGLFNDHASSVNPHQITPGTIGLENVLNEVQLVAANNLNDLLLASEARDNLELGTISTQNANSIAITGGTIEGVSVNSLVAPLSISDGGTGESTPALALAALNGISLDNVGSPNGVPSLDSNSLIPASQIPDINRGEVVFASSGSLPVPVSKKRNFRHTLTTNTTIVNPLDLTQLADEYRFFIEQDLIGGHTLSFDSNFVLMNFPNGFVMPSAPDAYIHIVLRKVENDSNFYVWIEPQTPGKFYDSVGNTVDQTFVVTHNLNTKFVIVRVFSNVAPFSEVNSPLVTVDHTSENEVTLNFSSIPSLDEYSVVVIS